MNLVAILRNAPIFGGIISRAVKIDVVNIQKTYSLTGKPSAYAYQDTFVDEPYSYIDDTGVESIVTSAETWYMSTYYDDSDPTQAIFTFVQGVQTIISTQPDSLLIFSNTTSKQLVQRGTEILLTFRSM